MWAAIGDSLPFAIGMALSPFAIITGIILLLGQGGRARSALFGVGWMVAILVLATVAFLVVSSAEAVSEEYTETGVGIVQLVFAALFLTLAVLTWLKRPRGSDATEGAPGPSESTSKKPSLLSRLDGLSAFGALGVGIAQGFVIFKNIPLALSGGARFAEVGLVGAQAVIALVVFAVIAALGVFVPLVVALVGGERLEPSLRVARGWLEANMSAITVTVLLVLGAVFLGKGLGIFD